MNFLKNLFQNMSLRSKAFDPALQQFMRVDQNALRKELDLESRAEKAGKNNTPEADVNAKDNLAAEIDVYLTEILRRGRNELQGHLRAIGELDAVQSINHQITELRVNTLSALNNFYAACRKGVDELYPKKWEVVEGESALEQFKEQNNLNRPANYPSNRHKTYWWIVFFLCIEAVFNAFALGSAHKEGPAGIFLETFVIAIVNVMSGVIIGNYFWRLTYHIKSLKVWIGWILVIIFSALVLIFNFTIGHYRDSLSGLKKQIAETSVGFYETYARLFQTTLERAFSNNFWAFDSLMSFLLSLVGITIFVWVAIKIFKLDDEYPKYGDMSRAQDERNNTYADLSADLQDKLQIIGNNTNENLENTFMVGQAAQRIANVHEQTLQTLNDNYRSWVTELKQVGQASYSYYRDINRQHRTESSPEAFTIDFSLPEELVTPPIQPRVMEEQNMKEFHDFKDICIDTISEAQNKYLGIYRTIEELAPKDVTGNRVSTYNAEVERVNEEIQELARQRGIRPI